MTTETQTAEARFAATVQRFDAIGRGEVQPTEEETRVIQQGATFAPRSEAQPTASAPNQSDADLVTATHRDAHTRGLLGKPGVRVLIERARQQVFEGKPLDRAALQREFGKLVGLEVPEPEAPIAPQGTPADRRNAEWWEQMKVDPDYVPAGHLFEPVDLHGYDLSEIQVPEGMGFSRAETSRLLAQARAAGLTQEQVVAMASALHSGLPE